MTDTSWRAFRSPARPSVRWRDQLLLQGGIALLLIGFVLAAGAAIAMAG